MSAISKIRTWIIVSITGIAFFLLVLFLRGDFTYFGFSDALFIPGAIIIAAGGMVLIERGGTFDILRYGFIRLFDSFKREKIKSFTDAYEYSEFRKEHRIRHGFYWLPYVVISAILIVVAFVFMLLGLQTIA